MKAKLAIACAVLAFLIAAPKAYALGMVGSCLAVDNQTHQQIRVTISIPSSYSQYYWLVQPQTNMILALNNTPVKATSETNDQGGHFLMDWPNGFTGTWVFDPSRTLGGECSNGTVIVTLREGI
jgi:hypothetical protein